jgi:DNA-binding MarR family transcriptional regulator
MEKSGWLTRARDPDNGKRQRIYITDAGRRKREEIASDQEKPENAFDPEACFSEEERETFILLLNKLEKHLTHLPEPSGK